MRRATSILLLVALFALLAGCASYRAFHSGKELIAQGKIEEGLAKLDEAVQLDAHNVEYRIALRTTREQVVGSGLRSAEIARREGRLSDAEAEYRRILRYDPENSMAKRGIDALTTERRHRQIVTSAEAEFAKGAAADLDRVAELLRGVLSENPNQSAALNLKARLEEAKAQQRPPAAELAAVYRKPITLEFRDAPLKTVFDAVSAVSGINFFFDKDIRPDLKVTVLAKDTAIEDAIRLVLLTNQLEQKVLSPNAVLIYPNTAQKLKDYQTMTVRSFYLANADVKAVSNTLKTILKVQDLVADERLGIIIMRDTPEVVRLAERLIALQDLSEPEVMLEVEVLEIKRSRLLELGVSWPDQVTLSPLSTEGGQPLTLEQLLHLDRNSTQATVSNGSVTARNTTDDADLLANPRIRVRNKDTARILIGDRVPVITTTSTSTGFVSDSVTYVDVGLKLEAEPNIYLDQDVAIKIHLEVSNLVKEVTSKAGTLAYQIGTRTADTVLRLKDGETQILAGLIRDEDRVSSNRIPGLGRLPILDRLFGSRKDDRQRGEIVLSITPRVVRALRRPDMVNAEFESGTASAIGARSLAFSGAEPAGESADAANGNGRTAGRAAAAAGAASSGAGANAGVGETRAGSGGAASPGPSGPPIGGPNSGAGTVGGAAGGATSGGVPGPGASSAAGVPIAGGAGVAGAAAAAGAEAGGAGASALGAATGAAASVTSAAAAASAAATAAPAAQSASSTAPPALAWQLPDRVRAGEQFTATLNVSSDNPLRGLPLLIGFDPQSLQVVSVNEGTFLRQDSMATDFSSRVDPIQGRIFVAAVRQNTSGRDSGITGTGSVASVTFKAVRPSERGVRVQLLSVSPEPVPAAAVPVPIAGTVTIVP